MNTLMKARACRTGQARFRVESLEERKLLTVGFSDTVIVARDTVGSAIVTLNRSEPTAAPLAAEDVVLNVGGGTAVAGVDYVATTQTVKFATGETSKDVTIPLLKTGPSGGTRVLEFRLTPAPVSGMNPTSTLVIEHGSDTTPPKVLSAKILSKRGYVTGIAVTFSKDMAAGPVSDTSNYVVEDFRSVKRIKGGSLLAPHLAIKSANYDPATHVVTLVPAQRLKSAAVLPVMSPAMATIMDALTTQKQIDPATIRTDLSKITDVAGNPLDSSGTGTPDGTLTAFATKSGSPTDVLASLTGLLGGPSSQHAPKPHRHK
jgi:hypothetical protein